LAKRQNRIKPIEHEQRQLENLKALEPNATPPEHRALSEALIDLTLVALDELAALENGDAPNQDRLGLIAALANDLPNTLE
jgi:hypothetical protein